MSLKSARIAKHVHLRTQQRRLRHLRVIAARNLQLNEPISPLLVETYFSLHRVGRPDVVIYSSEVVSGSLNPHWAMFDLHDYSPYNAFTTFVIKVWVAKQGGKFWLALERIIDLKKLMYIGNLPIKDSPPYVTNSLLFGLFEGYYSDMDIGMTSKIPDIRHPMSKYLPPKSLIEVPKSQVSSSYEKYILLRILNRQDTIRKNKMEANLMRQKIGNFLESNSTVFSKQKELEQLRSNINVLGQELVDQQQRLDKDRQDLVRLQEDVEKKEKILIEKKYLLNQEKLQLAATKGKFSSERKELLCSVEKKLTMRREAMITEAGCLFPIVEYHQGEGNCRTICGVRLPDELEVESIGLGNQDQYAVAVSYMVQLIQLLSRIQQIPLRFSYKFSGSRSYLKDDISKMIALDVNKELPLFVSKRNEKALFVYATHLVNREIVQLCQVCNVEVPKSQGRKNIKMLKNLKNLVDSFGKEKKLELTTTIRPLSLVTPRLILAHPSSVAHSSTASTPSSGPRTASNSFVSIANTLDEERHSVIALTDLHGQPPPYVDSSDGGGALQEEVGGAKLENKSDNDFVVISTEEVSNASSREDLTSASEVQLNIDRRERIPFTQNKEETNLKLTPIKQLTYSEGNSLLSPSTHASSHFSALSGLESVESPIKSGNA